MNSFTMGKSLKVSDPQFLFCNLAIVITTMTRYLAGVGSDAQETLSDFNFGGSKITADGDCSHKIKRHLLLGRKVMTNIDSIL